MKTIKIFVISITVWDQKIKTMALIAYVQNLTGVRIFNYTLYIHIYIYIRTLLVLVAQLYFLPLLHWLLQMTTVVKIIKIIRVWPGLDHVRCKLRNHNLEVQQRLPLQRSVCGPCPLFEAMIFASCNCTESPALVHMHAIIAIYRLFRATPINLLLLQKFYLQYAWKYSRVADLQLARNHFYLCKPRSCVCKLTGSSTYQSIEISICLSWVYIARYLQRIVNTIS